MPDNFLMVTTKHFIHNVLIDETVSATVNTVCRDVWEKGLTVPNAKRAFMLA